VVVVVVTMVQTIQIILEDLVDLVVVQVIKMHLDLLVLVFPDKEMLVVQHLVLLAVTKVAVAVVPVVPELMVDLDLMEVLVCSFQSLVP
jgi:hypothetical protein